MEATARAQQVDVADKEFRRRVIALITLAGADTETEATDLLGLLPDLSDTSETSRRHAVARWGRDLYPGDHGGGIHWNRICLFSSSLDKVTGLPHQGASPGRLVCGYAAQLFPRVPLHQDGHEVTDRCAGEFIP